MSIRNGKDKLGYVLEEKSKVKVVSGIHKTRNFKWKIDKDEVGDIYKFEDVECKIAYVNFYQGTSSDIATIYTKHLLLVK